jgi:hypothetical protein
MGAGTGSFEAAVADTSAADTPAVAAVVADSDKYELVDAAAATLFVVGFALPSLEVKSWTLSLPR